MGPKKGVRKLSKAGHRDTLNKTVEMGRKRKAWRFKRPRVICPQCINPSVILMREERTLNIAT